jgi:antitoxin HicB
VSEPPRKLPVVFYQTPAGAEVVLDWLRGLEPVDRNIVGQDLMRVQFRWPVGMPLCRPLGGGLWVSTTLRNPEDFTTLDSFLEEEGVRDTFQAVAIKEVLAWQIGQAMKDQGLSRKRLAERMGTSRSQISRLLDPTDGNVTLVTLQRAAELLGRKVRLELM